MPPRPGCFATVAQALGKKTFSVSALILKSRIAEGAFHFVAEKWLAFNERSGPTRPIARQRPSYATRPPRKP
jgi:hypothetical protein